MTATQRESVGEVTQPSGPTLLRSSILALWAAVAGGAAGASLMFFERVAWPLVGRADPFEDPKVVAFMALPQARLWLFLVGAQAALMAVLALPAWRMLRELKDERDRWAALAGLVSLGAVVAAFAFVAARLRPDYDFPRHDAKLELLTAAGFLVCTPAILVIWRVQGALEKLLVRRASDDDDASRCATHLESFDRTSRPEDRNALAGYLRLRELVHRSLLIVGAVIGSAILGAGALRNAVDARTKGAFPLEYVLVYGVFFTVLLAVVYAPTYTRLQATGRALVDDYARLGDPRDAGWSDAYQRRTDLIALLQLELSLGGSFQAGVAILAPLLTSLLGVLLPTK